MNFQEAQEHTARLLAHLTKQEEELDLPLQVKKLVRPVKSTPTTAKPEQPSLFSLLDDGECDTQADDVEHEIDVLWKRMKKAEEIAAHQKEITNKAAELLRKKGSSLRQQKVTPPVVLKAPRSHRIWMGFCVVIWAWISGYAIAGNLVGGISLAALLAIPFLLLAHMPSVLQNFFGPSKGGGAV